MATTTLKIGDVVHINSDPAFKMTVYFIGNSQAELIYISTLTQELIKLTNIPIECLTKI
jgi:hypothetical protein